MILLSLMGSFKDYVSRISAFFYPLYFIVYLYSNIETKSNAYAIYLRIVG